MKEPGPLDRQHKPLVLFFGRSELASTSEVFSRACATDSMFSAVWWEHIGGEVVLQILNGDTQLVVHVPPKT